MDSMSTFKLDDRLEGDTIKLASWSLCDVLLMNDVNYPWVILVPRVADTTEIYQLSKTQRAQLDAESTYLAETLMTIFDGQKMNVAALGNVVKQLHIHHVVRYESDNAWPAPIWGKAAPLAYTDEQLAEIHRKLALISNKVWTDV